MASVYRIFGSELSPYSVKVRSYFRYKQIPHEWIVRHMGNLEEFRKYATLPLIPLVVTPDDRALQDSTPIIEHLESLVPEPRIHPPDPALAFLSALLEEYGDEWGNKPMFHYRWHYDADQASAAERLARDNLPGASAETLREAAAGIRTRMISRLHFVGSSPATKDPIEASFLRQLRILERHLASRPYVFGGRPAFADFGLFAQLYECSTDPTPGSIIAERAPTVLAWIRRMLAPVAAGEFESWQSLRETLMPLLVEEVAGVFLPWSAANAEALAEGAAEFSVELDGQIFAQGTQKYHAKSLAALRSRYARVVDRAALDPVLRETGCLPWLTSGANSS
jgi:glutathione S-transferase